MKSIKSSHFGIYMQANPNGIYRPKGASHYSQARHYIKHPKNNEINQNSRKNAF